MWDMDLNGFSVWVAVLVGALAIAGCTPNPPPEAPKNLQIHQQWQVQPGDRVADYPVIGGLGDISIAANGNTIYAPIDGLVQPYKPECAIFSSPEVPIYLMRLCGLKNPRLGQRRVGEAIGTADILSFALLYRRPDSKWGFIEPSKQILELMLQPQPTPTGQKKGG